MPIVPPIPTEAEDFHREMSAGRNKPLLLGCRTASGEMVECVVKLSACLEGMAPLPYLAEWCGAAFAQLVGIAVPEAFQVEVTESFAQNLDPPWRERALRSVGLAFGSRLVPGGFAPLRAHTQAPIALREAGLVLAAFDVLIHNPDRRVVNPNALISHDEIVAIDHEMAFSFLFALLGAPDPVDNPCLDVLQQHAFAQQPGAKSPALDRFRDAVLRISQADLDALVQATPAAWQGGMAGGKLDTVVDVMRRRCERVDRWLPLVRARLET